MLAQRLLLLACCAASADAFKLSGTIHAQPKATRALVPQASGHVTRRALWVAPLLLLPLSAQAASVPSQIELSKLAKGYARLQYLLANWEQETTVCIKGCVGTPENCGCIRDPLVVQSYMGYKSMNDPLFKADQIMIRAQPLVKDADEFEKYAAAIDRLESLLEAVAGVYPAKALATLLRWMEKADEGNVMAYVSSWGEANPGGGRDNVERYLEKARSEVIESAQILRTIIDILNIPLAV